MYSWGTQQYEQLGFGSEDSSGGNQLQSEDEEEAASGDPNIGNQIEGTSLGGRDHRRPELEDDVGSNTDDEDGSPPPPPVEIVEKVPRLILGLAGIKFTRVCAGNHFALTISADGSVYSWGRNCFGQLGTGTLDKHAAHSATPTRVSSLDHLIAVDIAAGDAHTLGVFVSRAHIVDATQSWNPSSVDFTVVYSWGRGRNGCLGLGGHQDEPTPREVRFFRGLNATRVAAGSDHSLVLCSAGSQSFVYAFGGNQFGQLGVASSEDHIDMPTFVSELAGARVASIGAGARYSVALTGTCEQNVLERVCLWRIKLTSFWLSVPGEGELYTWGDAMHGKTHRSDKRTTFVPWKVEESSPDRSSPGWHSAMFVTQISVGAHHSLGLLRLRTWRGGTGRRSTDVGGLLAQVTRTHCDGSCLHNDADGEMDRWRTVPLGPIATYLLLEEGVDSSTLFARALHCARFDTAD